jgi:hypothetical protein
LNISRKPSTVSFNLEEDDEITNGIDNIRSSSGSSLDSDTRDFMKSRFGYDFSNVRIHAGESAARSSDDISALAYTIGNDIVFGREQYQPTTAHGRRLLAHELTHIVQQQGIFNHFNVIQRSRREEQNVSEILEQEEKFPDLYISAQISSQDFAESGAPEEGSSEEAMSTSSCPLTAVFLSTIVGPEKAGCQVPSGYHGASRLARFRIIGSKANDANGSVTVGEQFNVLDDPFGVIGLVHPTTYKTSAGIFDDCYMLYSTKPLPFNFVLKIEQNHLIDGQIVSKNHITYTPDHVSFCSFQ